MRYDPFFRYKGWDRRVFKRWKGYSGYVNDHHVIPKQFRNHPLVKEAKYDINGNLQSLNYADTAGCRQAKHAPLNDTTH